MILAILKYIVIYKEKPMTCPHCLNSFKAYKEEKIMNKAQKYMLKASCPICNKWLKWLTFNESKMLSAQEIRAMYDHNEMIGRGGF